MITINGNTSTEGMDFFAGDGTTLSTTSTTSEDPGVFFFKRSLSDAAQWFFDHVTDVRIFTTAYEIAGMVLSLVFNSYFLGVLILTKELRQLSYVPLILQALSDLISMGILGLLVGVCRLVGTYDQSIPGFRYSGRFAEWIREGGCQTHREEIFCTGQFFKIVANGYFTGPCVFAMALDRYILVCHPTTAKDIFTPRNRIIICIVVAVACFTPSSVAAYFTFVHRSLTDCVLSFYGSYVARLRVDNFVFFLLPFTLASFMYIRVALVLLRTRTKSQRSRNRNLTVAFLVSCCFWFVFWLPRYAFFEATKDYTPSEIEKAGFLFYFWREAKDLLYFSFSFVNPLVFFFISRSFQRPVKKVYDRIMMKVNPRRRVSVPSTSRSQSTSKTPAASSK